MSLVRFLAPARAALAVQAILLSTVATPGNAQSAGPRCTAGQQVPLAAASGRRVRDVHIVSAPPASMGGFKPPLHVTTRESTIRERLLVSPGDTVDTLRVSESLRRVRKLRYLAGAAVTASCDDGSGVDLTFETKDNWSMQPRVRVGGSSSALVGLEENNLLGTGRFARAYLRTDHGQVAAGASYGDPSVLGSTIGATVSRDVYRDGTSWAAAASTRDAGVFDRKTFLAVVRRSTRESISNGPAGISGDTVRREAISLLAGRRVARSATGGTFLQLGVEAERTLLAASTKTSLVGPAAVRRSFVGGDLGVARRTLSYAEVPWLSAPSSHHDPLLIGAAEVPLGWTADAVSGFGFDFAARQPAVHLDLWAGRVWRAGGRSDGDSPRAVIASDIWASGFRTLGRTGEWSAGSLRTSFTAVAPASNGLWSMRLGAERLFDPDPDTRGLAMTDPVLRAIPPSSRLAESAVSASLERSRNLVGVPGGYLLGVSLFTAGSIRWDPASGAFGRASAFPNGRFETTAAGPENGIPEVGRMYVGSVGAGVLLTPFHFGRSTIHFDVGYPVLHSPQVARRPYVSFTIVPAFGTGRQRGGTP